VGGRGFIRLMAISSTAGEADETVVAAGVNDKPRSVSGTQRSDGPGR
jgi:hypothetical protein